MPPSASAFGGASNVIITFPNRVKVMVMVRARGKY